MNWIREKVSESASASVRTEHRLAEPGDASSSRALLPTASIAGDDTPSIDLADLPTIDFAISARSSAMRFVKSWTCSTTALVLCYALIVGVSPRCSGQL